MTKLFNIVPGDSPANDWLFFEESDSGRIQIRPEYSEFQCRECGKVDEPRALTRPLPKIRLKGSWDVLGLMDGLTCVSQRFRGRAIEQGIRGLEYRAFPADPRYFLAVPNVFVEFDEAASGFERHEPKCRVCGRYREVLVGPLVASLKAPEDRLTVFACKEWNENSRGRVEWLFAREEVIRRLKGTRLTGVEYIEAL